MKSINQYYQKYGKPEIDSLVAVNEYDVIFSTKDGRFVSCGVSQDGKDTNNLAFLSDYLETWTRDGDPIYGKDFNHEKWSELATKERVELARQSISSPATIYDLQRGGEWGEPVE